MKITILSILTMLKFWIIQIIWTFASNWKVSTPTYSQVPLIKAFTWITHTKNFYRESDFSFRWLKYFKFFFNLQIPGALGQIQFFQLFSTAFGMFSNFNVRSNFKLTFFNFKKFSNQFQCNSFFVILLQVATVLSI